MLFSFKRSINKGISFGITSGVITTLGLIVGLNAGTGSKVAVIAGILSIAVADSFSDAVGMHISEEAQTRSSVHEVWKTTFLTLISKLIVGTSFVIPIILLPSRLGVIVSVFWGILITIIFGYKLARSRKENAIYVILEHVGITLLVIGASYLIGLAISKFS